MQSVIESLSYREIAIFFWTAIFLLFVLMKKDVRVSIAGIFKMFFGSIIGLIFFTLVVYVSILIFGLWKISAWDISLLKDTIMWFLTVALVLFYRANIVETKGYFKKIILDAIKLTAILEFIVSNYTFGLVAELILTPIVGLVAIILAFTQTMYKNEQKYQPTIKFLTYILTVAGLCYMGYAILKAITGIAELLVIGTMQQLLLTPILTILVTPFIYMLAVWIHYETLFVNLRIRVNDKSMLRKIRRSIIRTAGFSIDKIVAISRNFDKHEVYKTDDLRS